MNKVSGAPAHTKANCLQSNHDPRAKDRRSPIWERIFVAEQRVARIEG